MKPKQDPVFTAGRCPSAWEYQQVHSSGDGREGSGCPARASMAASVGTSGVVGGMVVGEVLVVVEVRVGHVRHMASMIEMVQVSQVAPA